MSLSFDPQAFDWVAGLVQWLVVCLVVGVLGWATAALLMFLQSGAPGLAQLVNLTLDMFRDFFGTSPRRVWALAVQTFREAWRGKLLWIFAIAAVLFMFAGMLLPAGKIDPEISTKSYVSFVWKAVTGLSVPLVLLLACWGLPQDIRLRSLHTVVTKPVRRHEIILGRILGLLGIGTAVLLVVGALGYVWVVRQHMGLVAHLPEDQRQPLLARVPVFADKLSFLTREGGTTDETGGDATGVNVGDEVMFRSFVEGNTKARAIWRFSGLNPGQFQNGQFLLDSSFQSFRTHKGKIDRELLTQYTLINPTNGLRVRLKVFKNREFRRNT
ncbi:MAG: ABC transporter permease [Planctomycetaceae bacterium]